MATFGERCKALRKEKGLNQEEFAKIIGVNMGTVSKWETDARLPEMNTIEKIAKFFGVAVFYLMGAVDEKHPSTPNQEALAEWVAEDEEEELLDALKAYSVLSAESKDALFRVYVAFYKQDKAAGKLLPDDRYEISVRVADKYRKDLIEDEGKDQQKL